MVPARKRCVQFRRMSCAGGNRIAREKIYATTARSDHRKGTCFVVMGFGKKTDFETGRVLDLDQSYHNLIKPAVEAAGLKCIRADEIVHSGLIDVPMYEQLLKADVVVADISTSNRNALYELGVRHALRPYTTVIIAEELDDEIAFFRFEPHRHPAISTFGRRHRRKRSETFHH